MGLVRCGVPLLFALPLTVLPVIDLGRAQPVLDRAVSDAQAFNQKGCSILKVNFNLRIRYASHFPLDRGEELRITLNAIDRDQAIALQLLKREAVRAPASPLVGVKAIDFETRQPTGSVLRIQFDRPVAYRVAPGPDVQSIVVAIAGAGPSPACKPEFPGDIVNAGGVVAGGAATGRISEADLRSAAAAMDEARAALKKGNPSGAIALLTKVLKLPENQYSAEAHELMGLARQRSGQTAAARVEYETYLSRYPGAEGTERVQQRLDAIITASGAPLEKLRAAPAPAWRTGGSFAPLGSGTTWTFSGSVSEFYIRDDSFRTAVDPSVAPDPNADADAHEVHQNELLSSIDTIAAWANEQARGKIRFSGTEEHHIDERDDLFGVAALFSEVELREWDVLGRLGRQNSNVDTGGVLGRFDGGLASWRALPLAKFSLYSGSPVLSRFDTPLKDQRYFYGASVGLGPFKGFDMTLFAIEQRDRSLLDRRAIGAEARYFDLTKSAFATVDYDVHFQQVNAAIFSGSWTLPDKSTLYGGADYRRTPYLSTWNALLNQPFATLYDMLAATQQSQQQLQQLAVSQTPIYKSAMIGYARPLNDKFQVSADATVVNLSQPFVLPNIDPALAALPAGNEYYYSTQLTGSSLIKEGDMFIAGLRYSQLLNSNLYVLDFNTRYPWSKELNISPRLRLGYRTGRGIDLTEYTALPSLLLDYAWTDELSSELEIGVERTWSRQDGVRDQNTELFLTAGVRYDFYADGATKATDKQRCATRVAAALCRYSNNPDKGACATQSAGCR